MTLGRTFLTSVAESVYRNTAAGTLRCQKRCYALSRFPERHPGVGRNRLKPISKRGPTKEPGHAVSRLGDAGASNGLRQLLYQGNTLVIERQIEMLNVFVGFEQSNKYTISGEEGEPLGYIAEDSRGFFGTLSRQFFATHRPFRAVIMDNEGNPMLFLRRPFAWINSRMFVQRRKGLSDQEPGADPALDTFGEVQQIWHPWRRRYDLFLREPIAPQGEGQTIDHTFYQVAKVDAGFLAWHFRLLDENANQIASIDRAFRGIGREVFTDTGRYSVHFGPADLINDLPVQLAPESQQPHLAREVSLDERALFLALAVNIDFDYFSRHSHVGGGGIFHFPSWD